MKRLSRRFFSRGTRLVAQDLLGRTIYRDSEDGLVSGRIVEVEAYCGVDDPGSHAYRRVTPRNQIMYGPPGHLYVYFTYGMHHCANIVTEQDGYAGAVLLRAVEPKQGIDLMKKRRGRDDLYLLAKGPARLCQAFDLDRGDNGIDLTDELVWVSPGRQLRGSVRSSVRIGLKPGIDQPWRYYEEGPWVSGPKMSRASPSALQ